MKGYKLVTHQNWNQGRMKTRSNNSVVATFVFFFLSASSSQADTAVLGKVTQVFRDTQRVVSTFTSTQTPPVNTVVVVTSATGEACEGNLLEVSGAKALIDLSACTSFQEIKAGSSVTRAEFLSQQSAAPVVTGTPQPKPDLTVSHDPQTNNVQQELPASPKYSPAPSSPPLVAPFDESSMVPNPSMEREIGDSSRNLRFSLGTLLSLGKSLQFDSAAVTVGTDKFDGKARYDMENAVGLSAEVVYSPRHSWGFSAGGSIETKRRLRSITIEEDGESQTTEMIGTAYLSFNHLYANAIYRWNKWYLPFGFNVSLPAKDNTPEIFKHMTNQAGFQVGVGFMPHEQLALELFARGSQVHLGGVAVDTSTYVEFGYGWLYTVNLAAKVLF